MKIHMNNNSYEKKINNILTNSQSNGNLLKNNKDLKDITFSNTPKQKVYIDEQVTTKSFQQQKYLK